MTKTIGIVGGMGPAATCDLMHKIIRLSPVERDQDHARILVDCNSQVPDRTEAILHGGESPVPVLIGMARRLEDMGAQVLLIPCNTSHYFYDEICAPLHTPVLHMLRETARSLQRRGVKTVGLLATDGTIQTGIYETILSQYGIRGLTPEGEDQAAVMSVIYDGIKAGRESMDTTAFCRCVERLSARGAELMVLGCTELPLAVELYHIHCRCIDPATELAKTAVRFALGREPKSI